MITKFAIGIILFAAVAGCSSKPEEPPIPEKSNALSGTPAKKAITQVRQTLNLTPHETFQAALSVMQRRGIAIAAAHESDGLIETGWINITDSLCGGHHMQGAPIGCRARMSIKIEPVSVAASALNIRYTELCAINEEVPLECPDSSAERLMLSVVEDVRKIDENANPPVR